jgi:adenylosuccinate lyase
MTICDVKSHITDSQFYSTGYTTEEAKRIFCDKYRYQRWMEIEAAMASVQGDLGIIPKTAAQAINDKAHIRHLDLNAIQKGIKTTSHSLLPLLEEWRRVCEGPAGEFIHFGATTQDIQDTAQVTEIRDVLDLVERDLWIICKQVMNLSERYIDLVMIGRSHTQHALSMTFGLKMAVWLDELWRDYQRLIVCRERVLVSQLFGGVGTMDAFGKKGFELLSRFSERLGLKAPLTAWHASRDRAADFLATMAIVAGTLSKIADEIRCLARSETGELEEPFQMGKIGSSTMPHKRNPEMCEQVVVLARLIKANASLGFEGMINEHERDYRAVRLEWVSVTDTSLFLCGALSLMKTILGGLIVHEERIHQNVDSAATLISTEALMFHLGETLGKQTAHSIVYEASMKAKETGQPLIDLLMTHPEVSDRFKRDDMEKTIDPSQHIGLSKEITRRTIDLVKKGLDQIGPIDEKERACPLIGKDGKCQVQ